MVRDIVQAMSQHIPRYDSYQVRILKSKGDEKTSFHILYLDEVFENIEHQKEIWKQINHTFLNAASPALRSIYEVDKKSVIDMGVYTKNRAMRTIYSKKPWKKNELVPVDLNMVELKDVNILDYFVETTYAPTYSSLSSKPIKPTPPRSKSKRYGSGDAPLYIKNRVAKVIHLLPGMDPNSLKIVNNNFTIFRVAPGLCPVCQRPHERQNGFLYEKMGRLYYRCFQDPSAGEFCLEINE
jgi:hypothetical protein